MHALWMPQQSVCVQSDTRVESARIYPARSPPLLVFQLLSVTSADQLDVLSYYGLHASILSRWSNNAR